MRTGIPLSRQSGYSWFSLISYFIHRYASNVYCPVVVFEFYIILLWTMKGNPFLGYPFPTDIMNKDVYIC